MYVFPDICQIRLDFDQFVIAGPANTMEQIGAGAATHCTVDTFVIVVSYTFDDMFEVN